MRQALGTQRLTRVYDSVAKHYDLQHALLTARSDQRGRSLLVSQAVSCGDTVLDCGAGTGSTSLLAARVVGPGGKVVVFDISDGMLEVAERRLAKAGYLDRAEFKSGDMVKLPFPNDSFDVTLSTYSLCPVYDPEKAVRELFRVTRPGGLIGIAHSTEPKPKLVHWIADRVENLAWHLPALSLGCRAVSVMPTLESMGCEALFIKRIGVPLWPFLVFVVEKPDQ